MELIDNQLNGLLLFSPPCFIDDRGYFMETFHKEKLHALGLNETFVQDNESMSDKGVLRGLHFQAPPYAQGKLIRVIQGAVLDVALDIRSSSPTYGQFRTFELSAENKRMLFLPPGFAHGFLALENKTIFSYKCTNVYHQPSEGAILWNDPDLDIPWNIEQAIVSAKDQAAQPFRDFVSPFP